MGSQRNGIFRTIGAIDGKHMEIKAPESSGSVYYNYHGIFSIVLMATADADYKIMYSNVGCYGRISDGGVFYSQVVHNKLNIPEPSLLPGISGIPIPFILVADDAFALSTNIMKPYLGSYGKGSLEEELLIID
jgi:hypothetical protein